MITSHHLPPSPRLTSGNLWSILYNLVTLRIVHKWDYTPLRSIPGSALCPLHVFLSIASLSDFLWSYGFQYQLHNDDSLVFISKFLEI